MDDIEPLVWATEDMTGLPYPVLVNKRMFSIMVDQFFRFDVGCSRWHENPFPRIRLF